jgi:hypothetical protein
VLLCVTMCYYGLLWTNWLLLSDGLIGYYGLLWVTMGYYRLIGYYGLIWVTMGYYGLLLSDGLNG